MRPMLSVLLAWVLTAAPATAMSFVLAGTDHRTADASWIQATGPIESTTLDDFRAFLNENGDWFPKRIRFDSPGGHLGVGLQLGEELRRFGFATEVGSHEPHPDWPNMPYWEFTRRTPGDCASACAYAFMGGVERRIDPGSRIGVHQFYTPASAKAETDGGPVLIQEGVEQAKVSQLLDYVLRMGIDGRVLVNAGYMGPADMHWIESGLGAQEVGLDYAPQGWSAWGIQILGQGVIAESKRTDGQYQMAALCTEEGGGYFDLFISEERTEQSEFSVRSWLLDQCLPAGSASQGPDAHRILGNRVTNSDIRVVDRPGGFGVRFPLGRNAIVDGGPSFLSEDASSGACITDRFLGNEEKMKASIQIAFRNCIQ